MSCRRPRSSSVTRWLLVVVGCIVMETVQPTNASPANVAALAPAGAATPVGPPAPGTVLYPGGVNADSPRAATPAAPARPGFSWLWAAVIVGGCGAWLLWRQRRAQAAGVAPSGLRVEETRPLGNRQFLVVASHEGRRFLLGVAPGNIRFLTDLNPEGSSHVADS